MANAPNPTAGRHPEEEPAARRAAVYVRMSTEHQQYSPENQAEVISRHTVTHGFEIARTYSDDAKSGLRIESRALRRLHGEVVADTIAAIEKPGGSVVRDPATDLPAVIAEFSASIVIARCKFTRAGARRWKIRLDTGLTPDLTVAPHERPQRRRPGLLPSPAVGNARPSHPAGRRERPNARCFPVRHTMCNEIKNEIKCARRVAKGISVVASSEPPWRMAAATNGDHHGGCPHARRELRRGIATCAALPA